MSEINNLSKAITEIVKEAQSKGTSAYDTSAEVVRVEDGTAWVHIPGGVDETPAQMTVYASPGDTVQIRVAGGRAWITGNASRPPTDDTVAISARSTAETASETAEEAQIVAEEAQTQVGEMKKHFFFTDDSGAHITEIANDYTEGNNILIDSDSVDVRKGTITIASFGENTQIGEDDNTHILMDFHSLKLIDKDNNEFFSVEDLRNEQGILDIQRRFVGNGSSRTFQLTLFASTRDYTVTLNGVEVTSGITKTISSIMFDTAPAEGDVIIASYPSNSVYLKNYTCGIRKGTAGALSYAEGYNVTASGDFSHAEGYGTIANGYASHVEGYAPDITGFQTGDYGAHAEGYATRSRGGYGSHSEGRSTSANGQSSHAEGFRTNAGGWGSHAEGLGSTASGDYSHAQNHYTIAEGLAQTALGKFNVSDTTSAFIIGNGTNGNTRSNALTIDWNGNINGGDLINNRSWDATNKMIHYSIAPTNPVTNIDNRTWKTIGSFTLPEAGDYMLYITVRFNQNDTGQRLFILANNGDDDNTGSVNAMLNNYQNAVGGFFTFLHASAPYRASGQTTLYLKAYQNSGGALDLISRVSVVRLR